MGLRLNGAVWACVVTSALCGCDKPRSGPDLSNPRSAAVTFATALDRGDVKTAQMASNAGGMEMDLVDAMAQCASNIKHLSDVARAKFGDDAKRLVAAQGPMGIATELASADVDQNAEQATVRTRDGKSKMPLKFVDGTWRVDIGVLVGGQDITFIVPQFRAAAIASRKVADDIEAGKCKTADDAQREMRQSLVSNVPDLLRKQIAATVPSSIESAPADGSP
jgi:hypothetical protein